MNCNNLQSLATAALLVTLGGCTTLEYVPIERARPETLRTQLEVGETVIVRLHSGDQRQLRIRALEPDAIVGRDARIPYADIDRLEVKTRDYEGTAKTALAAAAVVVVYIGAAILEAQLDDES